MEEATESGVADPAPWDEPGWRDAADAWIRQELTRLERPLTGPVEEVKKWCLSCVLRAPTDAGAVYFKAAVDLPLFVDEPAVLEELSALFPDHIPTVLAREPARRWMLMADSGTTFRWEEPPPVEVRERILGEYARLQRDTASRTADLLRIGCHDRRLPVLSEQIASLLAFADTRPDLTDEEKAHLHAIVPRLQEQIVELLASPLPATIAHGDLHIGNVAVRPDGTPVFFDWTDACITHPFLDMITIFQQTDEALKARLRNAYLAEWSGYDTPERLRTTFALAAPLSALHQAVSYQGILQYGPPETAKELGESLPYWLRCVLQWQTEAHG